MSTNRNAFTKIAEFNNQSSTITYTKTDLNTSLFEYCFKIEAYDICDNSIVSQEFCPNQLNVNATNNQNNISWNNFNFSTLSKIELLKDNVILNTYTATFPTTFTDTDVKCGTDYCYQIIAYTNNGLTQLFSEKKCVMALSADIPNIPILTSASVLNNKVELAIAIDSKAPVKTISIFKNNTLLTTLSDTSIFIDDKINTNEKTACYQIQYTDVCDNISVLSNQGCSMLLKGAKNGPNDYTLSWTEYKDMPDGFSNYELELIDKDNNAYKKHNVNNQRTYTDKAPNNILQINNYRVKAISENDNFAYSNVVSFENLGIFKLPNAFTPNGDNLNDTFGADALYLTNYKLIIYNRWGVIVYQTTDLKQPWTGDGCDADIYAYIIEAIDQLGKEIKETGTVMMIK
jgi:gliding motility-associated-like protein